ncbi:hypothetical protein D3C77_404050 [compost metagenome]
MASIPLHHDAAEQSIPDYGLYPWICPGIGGIRSYDYVRGQHSGQNSDAPNSHICRRGYRKHGSSLDLDDYDHLDLLCDAIDNAAKQQKMVTNEPCLMHHFYAPFFVVPAILMRSVWAFHSEYIPLLSIRSSGILVSVTRDLL